MSLLNIISYAVPGFPGRFAIYFDNVAGQFSAKYEPGGVGVSEWKVTVEPSSDYDKIIRNIHAAAVEEHQQQAYTGRFLAYAFSTTLHDKAQGYTEKSPLMENVSGVGLALAWAVVDEYVYKERNATGTRTHRNYLVIERGLGAVGRESAGHELTIEGKPAVALQYVFAFYTKGVTLLPYSEALHHFFQNTENRLAQLTEMIYEKLRQDQPNLEEALTQLALSSGGLLGPAQAS